MRPAPAPLRQRGLPRRRRAAFCLLPSGIYIVDDWVDGEKDRLQPEKRRRPIAGGHLGARGRVRPPRLLLAAGGALAAWVGLSFAGIAATCIALQLLDSFALERFVILDVMAIASGFAKRWHELSSLPEGGAAHRQSLGDYSVQMLDQMMAMVAAASIVAHGLYAVSPETVARVGNDHMKLTVPFVIDGIFRYLFRVHERGAGGSPARVLPSDPPLIVCLLLFVAGAGWALYG